MDLKVQTGRLVVEVCAPPDTSVGALKALLAPLTGQLARHMKLICKGRVLAPENARLVDCGVSATSNKLMLLANGGAAGSAPLAARPDTTVKPRSVAPRPPPPPADQLASRAAAWRETGLVALRDAGLASVPAEVWAVGECARGLDLHGNAALEAVPPQLAQLNGLTRLTLSSCGLRQLSWEALGSLSQLTVLALDGNALTELHEDVGRLTALKKLTLSRNQLHKLPAALGSCALTHLDASHNSLAALPAELGACVHLEELHLASNRLTALPAALGDCARLAVVDADGNGIAAAGVPDALLRAPSLHTLSLHANPVTLDQLRALPGWPDFERKRVAKVNRALGGNVLNASSAFDEGSDAIMRTR